jgi:hypothetical protein
VVLQPVDPSAHFRERRRKARKRRRNRRLALGGALVLLAGGAAFVTRATGGGEERAEPAATSAPAAGTTTVAADLAPRPVPDQIRGVHVTAPLASLPGRLERYMKLPGLNTIQLDVKDENGEVGFVPSSVPLASAVGAARPYYRPRRVARMARAHGVYLIGRIVCFEDPALAKGRPALALRRPDGSMWTNDAGLAWTSPYSRRVWRYLVDLGEAAARTGFDEIQFDYVRFPSDGDLDGIVYPGRDSTPQGWVVPKFLQYASKRLRPLGVRVSVDVFGLSASRDLGIGQRPGRLAPYVDAVYPMVYPSHYNAGEYGLADPSAAPGETVAASLSDFAARLQGRRVDVVPWLQDFSLGRTYTLADVKAQIDAALGANTRGFLLWNAEGTYTGGALTYRPTLG